MIVANIKSAKDLQAKKDLQKQLIDLEVSNEAERQKRFQEKGIKEKEGKKLVEQYRTPAEIRRDKAAIEKKALDLIIELGFPYNEAGQLVNWLGTSNRLADFTTSFKLIKKDIQEGYDKSIVDIEFLKNYLDNFFDDLDVNLGKKFSKDIGKNVDTGLDNIYGAEPFKNLPNSYIIAGIKRPSFANKVKINEPEPANEMSLEFAEYSPEIPTSTDLMFSSTGSLDLDNEYEEGSIINLLLELEALFNQVATNSDSYKEKMMAIQFKYKTQQILHLFKILISILPSATVQQDVVQYLSQNERLRVVKNITRAINKLTSIDDIVLKQIQTVLMNSITQLKSGEVETALKNLDKIYNVSSRQLSGLVNQERVQAVIKSYSDYLKIIETKSVDYAKRLAEFEAQIKKVEEEIAQEIEVETIEGDFEDVSLTSLNEVLAEKITKFQAIARRYIANKKVDGMKKAKADAKKEVLEEIKNISKKTIEGIISQLTGELVTNLTKKQEENIIMNYIVSEEAINTPLPEGELEEEISAEAELDAEIDAETDSFLQELRGNRNNEEYKKELDKVLKMLGNPAPSKISGIANKEFKIKGDQKDRIKAMNPLARVGREKLRPEGRGGMKTGLGVSKATVGQKSFEKLKKHFKGDEKLLKKVIKALQDNSSSDEEENKSPFRRRHSELNDLGFKELARHIKATDSIDKKIDKLIKGKGVVGNTIVDAVIKGVARPLGYKGKGVDTLKFLGKADSWEKAFTGVGFKATRIPVSKVGKGVKLENEENPTYRQFGKYVLHIPHLINNNTANFKYPSLGSIPSIKPLSVSQDYKDLILDVLQTGKLDKKEFERLPQSEIKHFERVALGAGLVEQLGLKLGNTEEDKTDSKRFELLRGEYLAGNNNQALIKELRLLITKFITNGRIHKNEGLNLLLELSTL
jgi:hypothetical protein